jgi:hypothetical protein
MAIRHPHVEKKIGLESIPVGSDNILIAQL